MTVTGPCFDFAHLTAGSASADRKFSRGTDDLLFRHPGLCRNHAAGRSSPCGVPSVPRVRRPRLLPCPASPPCLPCHGPACGDPPPFSSQRSHPAFLTSAEPIMQATPLAAATPTVHRPIDARGAVPNMSPATTPAVAIRKPLPQGVEDACRDGVMRVPVCRANHERPLPDKRREVHHKMTRRHRRRCPVPSLETLPDAIQGRRGPLARI